MQGSFSFVISLTNIEKIHILCLNSLIIKIIAKVNKYDN